MRIHGINTNERRAAFLARISAESAQLRNVEKNPNFSAPRLRVVWPWRFPTAAAADRYAGNPAVLGYGDERSGDGCRNRGRGLMQTTGRYNDRAAGFENDPYALAPTRWHAGDGRRQRRAVPGDGRSQPADGNCAEPGGFRLGVPHGQWRRPWKRRTTAGIATGVAAEIGGPVAVAAAGMTMPYATRLKPATRAVAMCRPGETPLFA